MGTMMAIACAKQKRNVGAAGREVACVQMALVC